MSWIEHACAKRVAPCLFQDLLAVIPPGSYNEAGTFLERFEAIDRADFCSHAFCVAHNKMCPLFSEKPADLEVAGLPCTDMSRAGLSRKEEGPTAPIFCCHGKLHVQKQTPLIIIENVQDLGGV